MSYIVHYHSACILWRRLVNVVAEWHTFNSQKETVICITFDVISLVLAGCSPRITVAVTGYLSVFHRGACATVSMFICSCYFQHTCQTSTNWVMDR